MITGYSLGLGEMEALLVTTCSSPKVVSDLQSLEVTGELPLCTNEKVKVQRSHPCFQAHINSSHTAMWVWSANRKFLHCVYTLSFFVNPITYQGTWSTFLREICDHIKNINLPAIKVCFAPIINSLSLQDSPNHPLSDRQSQDL